MAKTVKKKKAGRVPASKKTVKTKKTTVTKTKAGKKSKKKETPVVVPETVFRGKKAKKKKKTGAGLIAAEQKHSNGITKQNGEESFVLAEAVIKGLQEKKGNKIVWLNLSKVENAVADHFIICEAESTTQVNALGRSVEEIVKDEVGEKPWHSEGKQNAQWILVDYVSVVVHIFQTEIREFYNLEALWADAEVMEVVLQD